MSSSCSNILWHHNHSTQDVDIITILYTTFLSTESSSSSEATLYGEDNCNRYYLRRRSHSVDGTSNSSLLLGDSSHQPQRKKRKKACTNPALQPQGIFIVCREMLITNDAMCWGVGFFFVCFFSVTC